jgi:hypothetical protein
MARADLITSIVWLAIGLGATIESWRMPRLQNLGVSIYSAPGLVPFLLGIVIALLGLILLVRSLRAGRGLLGSNTQEPPVRTDATRRFAMTAGLTLGYALILVGRMPFWAATAIFVAAFVLAFEWQAGGGGKLLARRTAAAAGFALAVGVSVSVLFEEIFLVRLP